MEAQQKNRRDRLVVTNPITGAEIGDYPVMSSGEVAALVVAAREAQAEWSQLSLGHRAKSLRSLRRLIYDRADEIADTIRSETGKVKGEALAETVIGCEMATFLARKAPRVLRARGASPGAFTHRSARVVYEPFGVIGAITPWNYPFAISMSVIGTSIAAGNAIVLKPSEYTPATGMLAVELAAEATGMGDLVQLATGDGRTGAALVESGVDKIAFTGSTASGAKVMEAAARSLTPVVLELGGKDAMIVCGDADLERAARGAVWSAMYGCGQTCMAVERAYVVDEVYDEFVEHVVQLARRVRASDEPEAMIGSLIADFQRDRVASHVEDARNKGARVLLGGRALDEPGYFYAPTVVVDVDHGMTIMNEETFGPVLPIMRVADEDEAVRLTNGNPFGLDASVWTRSRDRARRIAGQLNVGAVVVNDHLINYAIADLPFGGVGHSGFGRVHGLEGLREFVRPKAWVEDRLAFGQEPHWFVEGSNGEEFTGNLLTFRHGRGPLRRLAAGLRVVRGMITR
jgi:succinate-semialdehyde dehydrogenase/glutarate-semialdehyde dehydrogenase